MRSFAVVRILLSLAAAQATLSVFAGHGLESPAVPPEDALLLLADGNHRFVAGASVHFQEDAARRIVTARDGQKPFAVVLTCADSRVPPELLFDQGIGCLFVTRVAGNVARTDEVATVEYAVGHLGTRLVVVLGHTRCGAVTAVVEGAGVSPNIEQLVAPIVPAVEEARHASPGARGTDFINAAIRANVHKAMADMRRLSPEIALAVTTGRVRLVGAIYDIESGAVEWLESPVVAAPAHEDPPTPAAAVEGQGAEPAAHEPAATPEAESQPAPAPGPAAHH